ncbi:MAG: DnaB-like helicase C-terminal domain-containing protein [Polyangiales bacterium]
MAGELGVTPSIVSQWASGACVPRETLAERLCEILGDDALRELAADARGREDRNPLTRWLRDLGLWGRGAHTKHVPACVFTLPRAQVALFLNRLFATDGWATVLTSGQSQLGYASVSERLARQVQHLLLRFGVLSSLRERSVKYQGGERAAWQIDITAADSIRTFCAEIGIFGKEAAVAKVVAALQDRGRHANRDVIPADVWGQIDRARAGRSWGSVGRAMGLGAGINLHVGARGLSRERLGVMAELLEDDRLRALSASDVYWDEVVSIECMGEKQVYDLTIPETHNFVANDVCVHNTSLVLNVATNAAVSSMKPVLVFSLEMPRIELANRLMCAEARVDQSRLRTNLLTQDEVTALTSAANKLHALPMYIDDSGDLTLLELRSKARRIKSERDMSLIVIDYLQLMKASRDKMESREREISEISRGLKSLAKELDVPIIALSQLNRGCETRPGKDKRPMLADLRESGAIEQDADVVMFIYRDEVYNRDTEDKGIAELIIAKQRNGPTDTVRLRFIRELTKFENLALDDGGAYHETNIGGVDEYEAGPGDAF